MSARVPSPRYERAVQTASLFLHAKFPSANALDFEKKEKQCYGKSNGSTLEFVNKSG